MSKIYIVFARESILKMNGNRGKLAAMAGHAALHTYWDAEDRRYDFPIKVDGVTYIGKNSAEYRASGKATKVCLAVDTVDDLKALYEAYRPVCGVSLVTDAGLTCFGGVPTTTCLGIGPISEDQIMDNLRNLRVLI